MKIRFHGQDSPASRLQTLSEETSHFYPPILLKFLVLIWSTLERQKIESTLYLPSDFEPDLCGLAFQRPTRHKYEVFHSGYLQEMCSSFLRIWLYLLKKFLMENFIFWEMPSYRKTKIRKSKHLKSNGLIHNNVTSHHNIWFVFKIKYWVFHDDSKKRIVKIVNVLKRIR